MKTLWQQVYGLGRKRLDYEYDLVSGKVNFLSYQRGEADQFYYKYQYDAENRLRETWSGTLALVKPFGGSQLLNGKMDAAYSYYLHGPLARMELGDQTGKVQGLDYAYTLQGWLKGVNGQELDAAKEMGKDGSAASTIAKDVMGYSLGYYGGDYHPIGENTPAFALQYQRQDLTGHNLYNGNISNTTVAISKFRGGDPVGYTYKYDQLNRLTRMRQHQLTAGASAWNASSITDSLKEDISYDGNGNILSYLRNGNGHNNPLAMDQLTYGYNRDYEGRLLSNQLQHVKDAVGKDNYDQDLDSQGSENYHYDQIGNLIADRQEGIARISWTVYGKIKSIEKTDGTVIGYTYDPSGNRATKSVNGQMTWYIRDAQGNTLGVYDNDSCRINWREQQLYGSSRLGMWKPNVNLNAQTGSAVWDTTGNRFFELSNHLGNVLAVISDKRTLKEDGTYQADVVSAQDYYPFGMIQPGRSFSTDSYRYGFNGKENDNEVSGNGNQYDYGFRIYNPRIGRFLSTDPLSESYPHYTPYQYAGNNPIKFIDVDGLEEHDPVPESYINPKLKIDMKQAPAGSRTNSAGFARNSQWFWRQMVDRNPQLFSSENIQRIRERKAPIIDQQWTKYNQTHESFMGETLIHHHIDQADMATPLPKSIHEKWYKALHEVNRGGRALSSLGRLNSFFNGLMFFRDLYSDDPHTLGMQFSAGSKVNTLYYDNNSDTYYKITKATISKDKEGNVVSKTVTFDFYNDYIYDKKTEKYEGIGKMGTKTETYDTKTQRTTNTTTN